MEGKNLEAVKNTADNFKSILPKDKLSGQDIKNFTKSLFKINDNNFEKQFTATASYDTTKSLNAVQEELVEQMIKDLTEQIFNATVANW